MNSTKIIIGSGILIGAAGLAYYLVKRSQEAPPVSTGSPSTPGTSLPSTTTPTPTQTTIPRVSKYPEGTLLRAGNSDPVYLIDEQGYRHWVTSRAALTRMGLDINDTKSISSAEMEAIPRLQNISGLSGILF